METFYEKVKVNIVELNEEVEDGQVIFLDRDPGVIETLEMISPLPLRDQVFMISNLLTISGFKQEDIAQELGVAHQTYRNRLLAVRKELRDKVEILS